MPDNLVRADVQRRFYALLLETKVESDGQVKGFSAWYDKATRKTRKQAERLIGTAWRKLESGHHDPDEVIIEAVEGLRWFLSQPQEPDEHPSRPEYAAFRFDVIRQIQDDHLRPFEVAALLKSRQPDFPEIDDLEIANLNMAGDNWRVAHSLAMEEFSLRA